jgi:hypothetical protein
LIRLDLIRFELIEKWSWRSWDEIELRATCSVELCASEEIFDSIRFDPVRFDSIGSFRFDLIWFDMDWIYWKLKLKKVKWAWIASNLFGRVAHKWRDVWEV